MFHDMDFGKQKGSQGLAIFNQNEDEERDCFLCEIFDLQLVFEKEAKRTRINMTNIGDFVDKRLKECVTEAPLKKLSIVTDTDKQPKSSSSLSPPPPTTRKFVGEKLEPIETEQLEIYVPGRLGQPTVRLVNCSGVCVVKGFELESHSNFPTCRGNVCVFDGKWMYEVTLGSSGVFQIGWATLNSQFDEQNGVGDSADSYSYDGKRLRKWNMRYWPYGQRWKTGDVIGVCIDLERGTVSFYRNGQFMDDAFQGIRTHVPGLAYFPAISLSFSERCEVNFGLYPFEYPIEGYKPLDITPSRERRGQAEYLLTALQRLLPYLTADVMSPLRKNNHTSLSMVDRMFCAAQIFHRLGPLLADSVVVVSVFVPFLLDLFQKRDPNFAKLIELLVLFLEPHEFESCTNYLLSYLSYKVRISSMNTKEKGNSHLKLATKLLGFRPILRTAAQLSNFSQIMENFFAIKMPNQNDLSQLIPIVWWPKCRENNCSKEAMEKSIQNIRNFFLERETTQLNLCALFLNDKLPLHFNNNINESTNNNNNNNTSPYEIFRNWLIYIAKKNINATRGLPFSNLGLSYTMSIVNLYHTLLHIIRPEIQKTKAEEFPMAIFCNNYRDYYDFQRLGGTLHHLRTHNPITNQAILRRRLPSSSSSSTITNVTTTATTTSVATIDASTMDDTKNRLKETDTTIEIIDTKFELFDNVLLLFHLGLNKKLAKVTEMFLRQEQLKRQLEECYERLDAALQDKPLEVENIKGVLNKTLEDLIAVARFCLWYSVLYYNQERQEDIWTMCVYLAEMLQYCSDIDTGIPPNASENNDVITNALLMYVPEFYLNTFIEAFHALRRGPISSEFFTAPTRREGLSKIIAWFVLHFNDKRIINPGTSIPSILHFTDIYATNLFFCL